MFDVFVSYAHEDVGLASSLASGLARIGKPWWRRRSMRVFRDANVMAASADLWDSIRGPLEESRWFVAVISPAAAASPWVAREIAWWVENRGNGQLLVLLADGTCVWDTDANDWAADATAVPAPLRGAFESEPRWVDATWTREQPRLQRRDGRVLDLLAEIAAPVQGTTKDAIVGEELRQHRRTLRTAVGAAALLLVLMIAAVVGAFVALDQRDTAESRREEALSQSLAGQAADVGTRRPDLGILLAVEAWRHAHTSEAEQALITAAKQEGQIPRVISRGKPALAIAYQSLDNTFVVLREDGTVERWRDGDETGWTGTGLRDSGFQTLVQLGPRVLGLSRGGTLYELDDSLHKVTGDWSVSSGPRWSGMGASLDGTVLVVGDQGGQLRVWSVADHAPIGPAVLAHAGGVNGVAVRGDGQRVVSLGATDNQLKTWTVTPTGLQPLGTFALGATGAAVAYLSDNRTIAVGEWNGAVQLLDADTLTLRTDFGSNGTKTLHFAPITQVIPISDPNTDGGFATVGLDGWVVRLTGTFEVFSTRRAAESTPLAAAINRTTGLTLIASADGTTSVVDRGVSSKFGKKVISQAVEFGDSATADRAVLMRYGSGTDPNAAVVTLRAVAKGGQWKGTVAKTASLPNAASAAALGGEGLAVADSSGVVRRYEGSRQTAVLDVGAVVGSARPVLVALRHNRLALVIGKSVAIIDTSNGKLRKTRVIHGPDDARFSAVAALPEGGRIAASMGDGSLRIFDVETGKEVAHTVTNARSSGLAISPDGKLIAQVDGLTGVVSIRDTKTLQPTGRDLVAPGYVNDLTWLDDGRRLATGSSDGSVHYWDIAARKQLADLPHGTLVYDLYAAPHGSVVYSAGLYSVGQGVREWDLSPRPAVRAACNEAGRNLTRDEWDTYLGGEAYRKTCP